MPDEDVPAVNSIKLALATDDVKPGDTYLESIRKYATPIYPALKPTRIKSIVSPAG
jgi:hypothetical protein